MLFTNSSLDWYKLTENTRFVLNDVVVRSAKALMKEQAKNNPNSRKIKRYESLMRAATSLSRNSANFESKERMGDILKKYGKIKVK